MQRDQRKNRQRGAFTLVELLVVLVVLAIAAAVVVPALDSSGFQAVSAARMVATDLQYAQNAAITTQAPVTVTFNVAGNSYSLSNASGALIHPMNKDAYSIDFDSQSGFGQLGIVSASFGGASSMSFDELGAPDSAGSVTVQAGASGYVISVAAVTGRVTVATAGS